MAMAPPPARNFDLQRFEVSVLVDIPPRDSEEFSKEQSAPLFAHCPPFCSGNWEVLVQWKGFVNDDPSQKGTGRFGVRFSGAEDRLTPLGDSKVIAEDIAGNKISLGRWSGLPTLPHAPDGEIYCGRDLVAPPSSESQVRIRIILEFDPSKVFCACRSRSTRRFNGAFQSLFTRPF